MKIKINYVLIILFFLGFYITPLLKAQDQAKEEIIQDIKTMEKILDTLLHEESTPRRFTPHNTKGVYIPEFGLIFHVQQNPFERIRVKILNKRMEQMQLDKLKSSLDTLTANKENSLEKLQAIKEKRIQERIPSMHKDKDIYILGSTEEDKYIAEHKEEIIQNIKDKIFIFYKKYTSSLRNLHNNDKIALIIDLDRENWSNQETEKSFLTSQIDYQMLEQYRKQKIKDEALKNSIIYNVSEPDGDINSSIKIMNGIINENLNKSRSFQRPLYNNGFYFNDLGIIFFLEIPEYIFSPYRYKAYFKQHLQVTQEKEDYKKAEDKQIDLKNKISDLKDNIFNIFATYGHTLQIHPDEYIIMNIDLGDKMFDLVNDQPSAITIKVRKKCLDDYYHGDLSKDNLQKKFVINSYFP